MVKQFFIAALFVGMASGCSSWVMAQTDTSLYGSIKGSDHNGEVPIGFTVHLSAAISGEDKPYASRNSQGPAFQIRVPTNTAINLSIQSDGYEPLTIERISTANISPADGYQVPPIPVTLTRILGSSLSRAEIKTRLRRARVSARLTGAVDLFLYNLEIYRDAYRNDAAILNEIEEFENETKSDDSFKYLLWPKRLQEMKVYREIINKNKGKPVPASNPGSLLNLIQDRSIFPGIRAKAINAFTTMDVDGELMIRALDYFREQSRDIRSELFFPALTALARRGTDSDKQMVIAGVKNADFYQAVGSINAVGEASLAQGSAAVAERLRAEPEVSLQVMALASLQKLAESGNTVAIKALIDTLSSDDTALVRARAAEAMFDAPRTAEIRRTLKKAAIEDESIDVRREAEATKYTRAVVHKTAAKPASHRF